MPMPPAGPALLEDRIKQLEEDIARLKARVAEAGPGKGAKAPDDSAAMEEQQESERGVDLYGYFDAGFTKIFINQEKGQTHALLPFLPDKGSFAIGNFNLYLDMHTERSWRFLGEVRFTLAPMGTEDNKVARQIGAPFARTDTNVQEPGNPENFNLRWSGIVLERAHVEYTARDWLKVRGGIFLTPYGIWNVDHGSPVVIPARVPFVIRTQIFPERQAGLHVSGNLFPSGVNLGYVLTLSNGRGLTALYQDLDENKAFGGRLYLGNEGDVTWRVGASWYTGTFTNTTKQYSSVLGVLRQDERITERYLEANVAFDGRVTFDPLWGLDLRFEYIRGTRQYSDRYRPNTPASCADPSCPKRPDSVSYGLYGLASFELPIKLARLRPYFLLEYTPQTDIDITDDVLVTYAGLNWRITPRAVLKTEYVWVTFTQDLSEALRARYPNKDLQAQIDGIVRNSSAFRLQMTYAF